MTLPLMQIGSEMAGTGAGFAFHGRDGTRVAAGALTPVPPGVAGTLAARLAPALAELPEGGLVGGALPFERTAEDCLWQAARCGSVWPIAEPAAPACMAPRLSPDPAPVAYAAAVAAALAQMDVDPGLAKVVLARSLRLEARAPIDRPRLLARLAADPAATVYDVALPSAGGARRLVGASPELLLARQGDTVQSHPLAGSARRQADPAADLEAAKALLASEKDQREHALVVEFILDTLAPLCRDLDCPEGTAITSTASMWHLGTRIEGRLRADAPPAPVLAQLLHPTPAVCGLPRDPAARLIRDLEPVERGFFAGAVGWCDRRGDGAWHVAIRCAEIEGASARLFAGAGIVPGSDPEAETRETGAKFGAMLSALGLPADAALSLTS